MSAHPNTTASWDRDLQHLCCCHSEWQPCRCRSAPRAPSPKPTRTSRLLAPWNEAKQLPVVLVPPCEIPAAAPGLTLRYGRHAPADAVHEFLRCPPSLSPKDEGQEGREGMINFIPIFRVKKVSRDPKVFELVPNLDSGHGRRRALGDSAEAAMSAYTDSTHSRVGLYNHSAASDFIQARAGSREEPSQCPNLVVCAPPDPSARACTVSPSAGQVERRQRD